MFINLYRRFLNENLKYVRYKHKENHWSLQRKKKTAPEKALEHFDDFYSQVYAKSWPSIREALLGTRKYIAVLNNFSDIEIAKATLENAGAINIRRIFELERQYVTESKLNKLRKVRLSKIYTVDKEITEKVESSNEVDVKETSHIVSLENKLKHAEFDSSRIIDSEIIDSVANLHEFIPATRLKGREDFIPESDHYNYYERDQKYPVNIIPEVQLHFPPNLEVYYFPDETSFESPRTGSTQVLDYYLLDGASLLPVLALDLTPGCRMLDVCAAPGGKSLIALQTLYPDLIVSNDVSMSRSNRIRRVFEQYLYDFDEKWLLAEKIRLTVKDGRNLADDNFDRILVDVPCTTDRHSLVEEDNNMFKPSRIKERLKIPELQRDLLVNALKLVRINGIVVYSTCSLSPIQNDGVVHMALKQLWEETRIEMAIIDLNVALRQFKPVFIISKPNFCKYGNVVLPDVSQNFGPMYFCKLKRIK